ncbi:MAG: DNA polymerase III subunit beta [bacterium]
MEVNIDKKTLLIEVSKVIGATEKKVTMPILSNILLKAEKNELTIVGTDLEVTIITSVECNIVSEGRISVPAKKFYDYIRELPDRDINIKHEDGFIVITTDKISGKLKVLEADDFPKVDIYKGNYTTLPYEKLLKMIDKTIYATSVDEVRYSLNGVYIEKVDNNIRSVATDSHRLSLYEDEEIKDIEGLNKGIIIPRKGLYELKKIGAENDVNIAIEKNKNFIAKIGNTIIQIRLLDHEFPDYKSVIPNETKINLKLKRDVLISAVKRAHSIYQEKTSRIVFDVSNDLFVVESNEPDIGEVREEIEIDYKGNPIRIGFNGKYLLDCLTAMDDEFVSIGFNNEQSASIFYPDDNKKHINLIMPIRI